MGRIDHYAILGKKDYTEGFYFIYRAQTLSTAKKRFKLILANSNIKPNTCVLVARDYDRNIVKVYGTN